MQGAAEASMGEAITHVQGLVEAFDQQTAERQRDR